jgi:hypothetical protein
MIAFRCLACHRDWILSEDAGTIRCHCGRSSATFDGDGVELLGPCAASALGDELASVGAGPPAIRRKPVPPLL